MHTLGQRISKNRLANGLTQAELAQEIGVTQPTIHNWEADKSIPTSKDLQRLRTKIGVKGSSASTKSSAAADTASGQSPFGAWLNRERTRKGVSVPQLSEKAHVSPAHIYMIESGYIANPRGPTRDKIADALGEKVPKEIRDETQKESSVAGLGELLDFDPHDPSDRPEGPRIYVLYDISNRPVYVGEGQSIKKRIDDHHEKFWFKSPIVETASYVEIENESLRLKMEAILIKFLKSNAVINKKLVDR